jgi:hypothetical protein
MTNQAQGRKKSNFPVKTSVDSGAYFDFVYSGTNYKILDSDFYASLGVTGTLVQLGSTTSIPILDKQGAVNRIRNLEAGNGVKLSLSPHNGAKITHNFVNGTGGVDVIKDPNVAQPVIKNLEAGTNISIADDGTNDSLIISYTGTAASTKTVIVSSISDFPEPASGVITLADDTDYFIVQDISTSNRFVVSGNTNIQGPASTLITLTYTGSGNMFTVSSGTNFKVHNINFACASGTVLSGTGGGTGQVQFWEARISTCDTLGSIGDMFLIRFDKVAFIDIKTNGLAITGTNTLLYMEGCYIYLNGGTYIDLGTATFSQAFIMQQIVLSSAASTKFLDGTTASGNIVSGGQGTVVDCRISGSATPLTDISTEDALWYFFLNDDISDTVTDALLSMQANATNTTITVAGTAVLVAGTWVVESDSQMTGTTAGRVTYNGGKAATLPVTASCSVAPVSGGSIEMAVYIAVNGTIVANSKRTANASSGSPSSITCPWKVTLNSGDYVEVFVANEDSTTDLLVSSAILRVN